MVLKWGLTAEIALAKMSQPFTLSEVVMKEVHARKCDEREPKLGRDGPQRCSYLLSNYQLSQLSRPYAYCDERKDQQFLP
jgi:hypothetical protein